MRPAADDDENDDEFDDEDLDEFLDAEVPAEPAGDMDEEKQTMSTSTPTCQHYRGHPTRRKDGGRTRLRRAG